MRDELIGYLRGLSDINYQYRAWVHREASDTFYDELDYVIHFLFDDTGLATDTRSWIGLVLIGEDEAQAVEGVVMSISELFFLHGVELEDVEYLATPAWMKVVESSKEALAVFLR
ncbi:hypothetical protein [Pseudomonas protegens]|uniref:SCO4402 family protein n=1 Tax=Pseudomonas protegens TaxID=380021 RepID=UPI00383A0526